MQLQNGFNRLYQTLPDLTLDVPSAPVLVDGFLARARTAGHLPSTSRPISITKDSEEKSM